MAERRTRRSFTQGVQGAGGEAGCWTAARGCRRWRRSLALAPGSSASGAPSTWWRLGRGTGRPQGGAGGNAATEARGEAARRGGGDPPQGGGFFRQGDRVTKFAFVSAERVQPRRGHAVPGHRCERQRLLRLAPRDPHRPEPCRGGKPSCASRSAASSPAGGSTARHASTPKLRREGLRHSRRRVARLMREMGLSARRGRRRTPRTTDSRHDLPVAPNLLGAELHRRTGRTRSGWLTSPTFRPTRASCI